MSGDPLSYEPVLDYMLSPSPDQSHMSRKLSSQNPSVVAAAVLALNNRVQLTNEVSSQGGGGPAHPEDSQSPSPTSRVDERGQVCR